MLADVFIQAKNPDCGPDGCPDFKDCLVEKNWARRVVGMGAVADGFHARDVDLASRAPAHGDALGVVEPTPEIVASFDSQIGPLDERIGKNAAESRTSIQIRDLLLPKLISGEIRLRDTEKAMDAVA